jgi:hypothetical protein
MIGTTLPGPTRMLNAVDACRYDPATGAIVNTYHIAEAQVRTWIANGEPVVEGAGSLDKHWVKDGAVVAKAPCPAKLDGLTLSDLPVPCRLQIGMAIDTPRGPALLHDPAGFYDCTDGVAELTFPSPGRYIVEVTSVGFLTQQFVIAAP